MEIPDLKQLAVLLGAVGLMFAIGLGGELKDFVAQLWAFSPLGVILVALVLLTPVAAAIWNLVR